MLMDPSKTRTDTEPLHPASLSRTEGVHIQLHAGHNHASLDDGHQTALHRAAVVGNRDAISALIQGGCALDLQDKEGNTALHEVAWHGFSQSIKVLVKAGADVHVKNKAGSTALHLACQNAHAQSARVLLLGGSMPDSKNNAGDTCLHIAARYNHLSMIKILLGAFCSVAEQNQAGDTALHVASTLNHKKTVSMLLEAGTDCNIKNYAGKTPLDKAREQDNREVAILLAKSNHVQKFARGRTVRKRRDLMRVQRRSQSVPREEELAIKDSASVAEDAHSSDHVEYKTRLHHHRASSSPRMKHRVKRLKERSDRMLRRDYGHVDILTGVRQRSSSPPDGKEPSDGRAYQLYTLYRDKDGQIKQAPANGCNCKPLIKKLESQLKATEKEMRLQIHTVQEEMNSRLGRIQSKSQHQIKILERLERMPAERLACHYRINHNATTERLEDDKRRASALNEVKSWCTSKCQNIQVHMPAEAQYYKLLKSPSADTSLTETDPESLPLLSILSEESTSSLATYVNVLPSPLTDSPPAANSQDDDDATGMKYLQLQLNRSSDDYRNISEVYTSVPALQFPTVQRKALPGSTAPTDPRWLRGKLQDLDHADRRAGVGEELRRFSSASSSLSPPSRDLNDSEFESRPGDRCNRQPKDRAQTPGNAQCSGGTHTLEIFAEWPSEPSFTQERANLHAVEVTQRFFETVSTQLERWYERKLQEAQSQAEQRARQDRTGLLERIGTLEEELRTLRASERTDQ